MGMTIAHVGVAIVAGYVGRDWKGHAVEGNICAGLICNHLPQVQYLTSA